MVDDKVSFWEQEPLLVQWKVETWEHAVQVPGSFGLSSTVKNSRRLLSENLTAPIYALLTEAERLIMRLTEPLPPLDARLLRDAQTECLPTSDANSNGYSLRLADRVNNFFGGILNEIVPNWNAQLESELKEEFLTIREKAFAFASLGLPHEDFSIHYGYRIRVTILPGHLIDPKLATYRSLLIGSNGSTWQPGAMRDLKDEFMRWAMPGSQRTWREPDTED